MDSLFVSMQALLSLAAGLIALACCGHRSGFPIVIVGLVGLIISAGYAAVYFSRLTPAHRTVWQIEARQGLMSILVGLVIPIAAASVVWNSPRFQGLASDTVQAGWVGVSVVIIFVAILTSSMVDRFFVLPRILGLWGLPIWHDTGALDNKQNRRLAQWWIAHRGVCELFVFTSLGVALAIIITAIAQSVSANKILAGALDSLGGAGVAITVFSVAGLRWQKTLLFVLSGPIGLGAWVTSKGSTKVREVTGLVIDVSVEPGVKIVSADGDRFEIDLRLASELRGIEGRPDEPWCRKMAVLHLLKLNAIGEWSGP